jgi:hypothetical protein
MTDADLVADTTLPVHACWELLRSVDLGRLAVINRDDPDIFPVNYVVDHGTIVFRTGVGTKLAVTAIGGRVAFEVDGYEPDLNRAWSVVLKGSANVIANMHEIVDAARLPLYPAHDSPKQHFIRIEPVEVTGRRFPVSEHSRWRTVLTDAARAALE